MRFNILLIIVLVADMDVASVRMKKTQSVNVKTLALFNHILIKLDINLYPLKRNI